MNIIHHMHIGIFPQQLYNAIMKISHNFAYIQLPNIRTDIPLVFPQKYLIYWRFIRTDLSRNYSYDTLSLFSTLRVYQYPPYTHSSMVQSYLIIPLTTERYSAYYQHYHSLSSITTCYSTYTSPPQQANTNTLKPNSLLSNFHWSSLDHKCSLIPILTLYHQLLGLHPYIHDRYVLYARRYYSHDDTKSNNPYYNPCKYFNYENNSIIYLERWLTRNHTLRHVFIPHINCHDQLTITITIQGYKIPCSNIHGII